MELLECLGSWLSPAVYKIVLSSPRDGAPYRRVVLQRLETGWQRESFTEKQAFHQAVEAEAIAETLSQLLAEEFRQLNAWDDRQQYSMKLTKKEKLLFQKTSAKAPPKEQASHNRTKNYCIPEGTVIAPLVDMGIFTAEGKVVRSMYDKYRQINRFVELVEDQIDKLDLSRELSIIDFGCGKSYLTFILYYYLVEVRHLRVSMVGLDLKADVIDHCNKAAEKYGYNGLRFQLGDISGYTPEGTVDFVITLHACDTATDFALYNAVQWGAGLIMSVPCCQHELCGQLHSEEFSILGRYGIIKERTAALMTDAIRANLLVASGYETQLLEFVDMSHTPKNLLIRAVKGGVSSGARRQAREEAERLTAAFELSPTLCRLLEQPGKQKT